MADIWSSEVVYRLGWALLHTLWLGFAVAFVLVGVLAALRRRSANARYVVACAALGVTVALLAAVVVPLACGNADPSRGPESAASQSIEVFELAKTTRIDGNNIALSSWQAQRLKDVQDRLVRELTQRTGWQWEVTSSLFRSSGAPADTIFFSKTNKVTGDAFVIHVTRESVVIEAASPEGFDKAVDALLDVLVRKDGKFLLTVGPVKPAPGTREPTSRPDTGPARGGAENPAIENIPRGTEGLSLAEAMVGRYTYAAACEVVDDVFDPHPSLNCIAQRYKVLQAFLRTSEPHMSDPSKGFVVRFGKRGDKGPAKGQRLIWVIRQIGTDCYQGVKAFADTPTNRRRAAAFGKALHAYSAKGAPARLGDMLVPQGGTRRDVSSSPPYLSFSLTGRFLAGWGLTVWDAVSGRAIPAKNFGGPSPGRSEVHFLPDGRTVVVSRETSTSVWDLAAGKKLRDLDCRGRVLLSNDGKVMLTSLADGTLSLWRTSDWKLLRTFRDPGRVCMALSPNGKYATTSRRRSWPPLPKILSPLSHVTIWNTATGKMHKTIRRPGTPLDFTADSGSFATFSEVGVVVLHRLTGTGRPGRIEVSKDFGGTMAFAPDGVLAAICVSGGVCLLDLKTGGEVKRMLYPRRKHESLVTALAFTRDSGRLASCDNAGNVRIWDLPASPAGGRARSVEAGTWSNAINGVQGRFVVERTTFKQGEPFAIKLQVRNAGDKAVRYASDLKIIDPDGAPAISLWESMQISYLGPWRPSHPLLKPGEMIETRLDSLHTSFYLRKVGKYRLRWEATDVWPHDPVKEAELAKSDAGPFVELPGGGLNEWLASKAAADEAKTTPAARRPAAREIVVEVTPAPGGGPGRDLIGPMLKIMPPGWSINGADQTYVGLVHRPVSNVLPNSAYMKVFVRDKPDAKLAGDKSVTVLGKGKLGHVYLATSVGDPLGRWNHAAHDIAVALAVSDPRPTRPAEPDWGRMVCHILAECLRQSRNTKSLPRVLAGAPTKPPQGHMRIHFEFNPPDTLPGGLYAVGPLDRAWGQSPNAHLLYQWRIDKKIGDGYEQLVGRLPLDVYGYGVKGAGTVEALAFTRTGNRIVGTVKYVRPLKGFKLPAYSVYLRAYLPKLPPGRYTVEIGFEEHFRTADGKAAPAPKGSGPPMPAMTCKFQVPAPRPVTRPAAAEPARSTLEFRVVPNAMGSSRLPLLPLFVGRTVEKFAARAIADLAARGPGVV